MYGQCERRVVAPEQGSLVSQSAHDWPNPGIGYTASIGQGNWVNSGAANDLSSRQLARVSCSRIEVVKSNLAG
jgi:hypothetical protein